MKKNVVTTIGMLIILCASMVCAVQPNYVETTTHHVNGDVSENVDITSVTTEYSDGLGRPIQKKTLQIPGNDLTVASFYDAAGRLEYTTKPFIDNSYKKFYLPGYLTDENFMFQLKDDYNGDTKAYSKTEYWDDPLGRVKKVSVPGENNTEIYSRSWTFGVDISINSKDLPYGEDNGVKFENGIITEIEFVVASFPKIENLLDRLYSDFLTANPFSEGGTPQHFLTVTLDPEEKITEQITDIFGKAIKTYSGPYVNNNDNGAIASRYEYDILGNVLKEFPPVTADNPIDPTEYRYNTLGQVIWKKTPDGGEFDYTYRDDGQIENVFSVHGTGEDRVNKRRVGYEYDNLGRMVYGYCGYYNRNRFGAYSETVFDQTRYFYDNIELMKQREVFQVIPESYLNRLTNLKGRLVACESIHYMRRVQNNRIIVGEVFSYDDEGRIQKKYTVMTGSPLVHESLYTYDIHGKLQFEAFYYGGDHFLKRYIYDPLGRLWWVDHGTLGTDGNYSYKKLIEYEYDQLGRVKNKTLAAITSGNHKTTFDYDILDRVTDKTTADYTGTPTTKFMESIWKYSGDTKEVSGFSKSGNITDLRYDYAALTKKVDETYIYDYQNRLTGATISPAEGSVQNNTYEYDQIGRFKNKTEAANTIAGYQYYDGNNRLQKTSKNSTPGNEYIYDYQGNLVVDFTKNLVIQYDWRNLPIAFRFYSTLRDAGLTKDTKGKFAGDDLYALMETNVSSNKAALLSTVYMLYNASGSRVCKMDVKE